MNTNNENLAAELDKIAAQLEDLAAVEPVKEASAESKTSAYLSGLVKALGIDE